MFLTIRFFAESGRQYSNLKRGLFKVRRKISECLIKVSVFAVTASISVALSGISAGISSQDGASDLFSITVMAAAEEADYGYANVIIEDSGDEESVMQGFFFDTVTAVRIYGGRAHELAEECAALCAKMEDTFSAQRETSELYKINHRTEQTVEISDDLAACLKLSLELCEATDGVYDITVYPVYELWDFHGDVDLIPEDDDIKNALEAVGYEKVHLEGNTLTFDSPDTMIDLGSAAKGYVSQKIKEFLTQEGCESALIDLGRNISTVGAKPNGSKWKVGLQLPFAASGELLDVVEVRNQCVISSGIYERYFERDGVLYHHILDPADGYPVQTDLNMAAVIGDEGTDDTLCDILSTVCVLLGKEEAEEFLNEQAFPVKVCLIDRDNKYEWVDHD